MSQVFHQKLEIKTTKVSKKDFISGPGLSAQPYLKQPWFYLILDLERIWKQLGLIEGVVRQP